MLSVAYISTNTVSKVAKPSKKELFHNEAIRLLAMRRIHDREKAKKLFAAELAEIEEMENRLKTLKNL